MPLVNQSEGILMYMREHASMKLSSRQWDIFEWVCILFLPIIHVQSLGEKKSEFMDQQQEF